MWFIVGVVLITWTHLVVRSQRLGEGMISGNKFGTLAQQGGMGIGGRFRGQQGGMTGGIGGGKVGELPKGYTVIKGELVDTRNKVIQKVNQGGSMYFSFENQKGPPVFRRRDMDTNLQFILFPDTTFPPGEGHYVVLRKFRGLIVPGVPPSQVYEAFHLSIGDSVHGFVNDFDNQKYLEKKQQKINRLGGMGMSMMGRGGGYGRKK